MLLILNKISNIYNIFSLFYYNKILSSVTAFSRKTAWHNLFSWDRMMGFHRTKCKLFLIYVVIGLRVAILRFLCKSTFSMEKTDFFAIIFSIFLNV